MVYKVKYIKEEIFYNSKTHKQEINEVEEQFEGKFLGMATDVFGDEGQVESVIEYHFLVENKYIIPVPSHKILTMEPRI